MKNFEQGDLFILEDDNGVYLEFDQSIQCHHSVYWTISSSEDIDSVTDYFVIHDEEPDFYKASTSKRKIDVSNKMWCMPDLNEYVFDTEYFKIRDTDKFGTKGLYASFKMTKGDDPSYIHLVAAVGDDNDCCCAQNKPILRFKAKINEKIWQSSECLV